MSAKTFQICSPLQKKQLKNGIRFSFGQDLLLVWGGFSRGSSPVKCGHTHDLNLQVRIRISGRIPDPVAKDLGLRYLIIKEKNVTNFWNFNLIRSKPDTVFFCEPGLDMLFLYG